MRENVRDVIAKPILESNNVLFRLSRRTTPLSSMMIETTSRELWQIAYELKNIVGIAYRQMLSNKFGTTHVKQEPWS